MEAGQLVPAKPVPIRIDPFGDKPEWQCPACGAVLWWLTFEHRPFCNHCGWREYRHGEHNEQERE